MAAIFVHDGNLSIFAERLPHSVNIAQLREAIDEINDGLRESGEIISSVNDLERALELHSGARVSIPDEVSDLTFEAGATDVYSRGESGGAGIARQNQESAVLMCSGTRAHWPHESTTVPGEIVGKASGSCNYQYGPPQKITYDAISYLQQWVGWWIFGYRNQVGLYGHASKSGNSVWFEQYEVVAVTPCTSGAFCTRLALYIYGSNSGRFYPYPGLYASLPNPNPC